MTTDDNRALAARLSEIAGESFPDYFDDALAVAMQTRQRPAWTFAGQWLPVPLTGDVRPQLRLVAILLMVVALIAALFVGGLLAGGWFPHRVSVIEPVPSQTPLATSVAPTPDQTSTPALTPPPTARPSMYGYSETHGTAEGCPGFGGADPTCVSFESVPCVADVYPQRGQGPLPVGPAPAGAPSAGSIALQLTSADGESRLGLLQTASGDVTPLTRPLQELALPDPRFAPGDFFIHDVYWSADGGALLFGLARGPGVNVSDDCGTFVVSADGEYLRRLELGDWYVPSRLEPGQVWSPDGSAVLVQRRGSIGVAALDGSAPVDLGYPVACRRTNPACVRPVGWSPDGHLIAVGFCCSDAAAGSSSGVAVVNVRDGHWAILSDAGWVGALGWLSEGTVAALADDGLGIYALQPDQPGVMTRVAFAGSLGPDDKWSPDRTHALVLGDPEAALKLVDLNTGQATRLAAPAPINEGSISWSPDGSHIAFVTEPSFEVWAVGADGSDLRMVGTAGGNVLGAPGDIGWQPAWP